MDNKTNMTEGQKRMLMILFTALLCIVVLTMAILPMNETIKENEEKALNEEARATEMRTLINNTALPGQYQELWEQSQLIFERNYRSFKANEKIEEIFQEVGVELRVLTITDYVALDTMEYEMNVVQPRLPEVAKEMRLVQNNGPLMHSFLVSKIEVEADLTEEQMYQVIDELNNIAPQAPGDEEVERYCLHLPEFTVTRGEVTTDFSINMYGMQPPPIAAAEIAQSED